MRAPIRHSIRILVTAFVTAAATVPGALSAQAAADPSHTTGTFAAPADATNAYTYLPAEVPVGALADVRTVATSSGSTVVTLHVRGLRANEEYGAHAHYRPCGATAAVAGAHYQHVADPATEGSETAASTDPVYANPVNEVWLDFTTNSAGNGRAQVVVDWQFRPSPYGSQRSVVIHVNPTSHGDSGAPPAGNAGPRAACITASV